MIERLLVAECDRRPRKPSPRELHREAAVGVGFLAAATAAGALLPSRHTASLLLTAALVGAYALASRIRFRTGSYWTVPTELVFVPMLCLLATPWVPLLVALGNVVARLPDYIRRDVHPARAIIRAGDAWYALGPALVIVAGHAETPAWGHWPIYAAALAAQFAFDLGQAAIHSRIGLKVALTDLLNETSTIFIVDAALAPLGLLVAFAAAPQPWAFALALPLLCLFAIFAREREARIEHALTLSHAYRGTAHLLGELLSTSSSYTGAHSRSVVVLAHEVARALGLDEKALREVEFGALLHDVGKIKVPDDILNKPGALTSGEWDVMRQHTAHGERMLERIGGMLGEVGTIVRNHHERWDGGGYPDGLEGDEIPLPARIVACCDAFNAMTTERPYREAMSLREALVEVRSEAGRQFDPAVVEALVATVEAWAMPAPQQPRPTARQKRRRERELVEAG